MRFFCGSVLAGRLLMRRALGGGSRLILIDPFWDRVSVEGRHQTGDNRGDISRAAVRHAQELDRGFDVPAGATFAGV